MKARNFVLAAALTLIICISSQRVVKAGGLSSVTTDAGAAVIKGVVKFAGVAPAPQPIRMSADPSCARQHSRPVLRREVVVDSQGGLQYAIVFIANGLGDRTFDPPAQPAVIFQKGCLYEPHLLAVRENQPFEVVNDDPTSHNIHPTPANNREWNKAELPGAKVEEAFAREEIAIPVKCNIHPWMHGTFAVMKTSHYALSGDNGDFTLPDLPAGKYTVTAWHESYGTQTQEVTISGSEKKSVNFVFKAKPY